MKVELSDQEINDLLSALNFFRRNSPSRGSAETKAEMLKLENKLWKYLRAKGKR